MADDTKQSKPLLDEKGKFAKGNTPPAGFNVNPQNRSSGGWKKENVFSYQYKRFMNMTLKELEDWNTNTGKDMRTVVEDLAFRRVNASRNSLPDVKEISDRTEGKASQSIDLTSGGDTFNPITVRVINGPEPDRDTIT